MTNHRLNPAHFTKYCRKVVNYHGTIPLRCERHRNHYGSCDVSLETAKLRSEVIEMITPSPKGKFSLYVGALFRWLMFAFASVLAMWSCWLGLVLLYYRPVDALSVFSLTGTASSSGIIFFLLFSWESEQRRRIASALVDFYGLKK